MFRPILATPTFQDITQIVRILPHLSAWIGARRGDAKPQCFGDSPDSKNDSIYGSRREMQRATESRPYSMLGKTHFRRAKGDHSQRIF
jgi:hypothetical protein